MTMRTVAGAVLAGAAASIFSGCGTILPAPVLSPDSFVVNQPVVGSGTGAPADRAGALVYDPHHRPVYESPAPTHISDTVKDSVQLPGAHAQTVAKQSESDFPLPEPFKGPATQPTDMQSTGQFQILGVVLAKVNSQPIYADKVLKTLERPLAAEARSSSEQHFRVVAEDLLNKQLHEFIENELEYAAASKSLEKGDEQIARSLTNEWRKDQIRRAGGSEAVARQRTAEDGQDFEELAQQQYRLNMTRLYYQKKIFPLIQVTAQDMRNYYRDNIREFQKPSAAKFRVIWIGDAATGDHLAAEKKAEGIYRRSRGGEDFATLASKFNDDPALMRSKGVVGDENGWMEKGAYAAVKVEEAIWELKPGEVTPPVSALHGVRPGFYVAKLEALHATKSDPFDDQKVQDAIHETLRRIQFGRLRDTERRKLLEGAAIVENPGMRDVAMEMIMQRYPVWVASR